jgi:hypothetical protein
MLSPASTSTISPTLRLVPETSDRSCRSRQQLGLALGAGLLQRFGLRLAAAFGDGFGEIGEQHREPQPQDDLEGEAEASPPVTRSRRKITVVSAATISTTNITGS